MGRGEMLLQKVHEVLAHHRHNGRSHLLAAMEHETDLIEALMTDIKSKYGHVENVFEMHHIHAIEEELLHHENRVAEEMAVLAKMEIYQHHAREIHELVTRGEELLKEANHFLHEHGQHNHGRDLEHLKIEVKAVEALLHELRDHNRNHDLKHVEEQLARHEQSLKHLIDRIAHRHHHDHHHDEHHHEEPLHQGFFY